MKRAVFVYARADSQRLPGKALMPLGCGGPLLGIVLARARMVEAEACVLLTSTRAVDDQLAELGSAHGVQVVRGDAFNLVQRTLQAIKVTEATHFLRVNGDSPLFSPILARHAMAYLAHHSLVSNLFDRRFPYGVAVEWVAANSYQDLALAAKAAECEHITAHLYRLHEMRQRLSMTQNRDDSGLRLALDTQGDHDRLSELFRQADPMWTEYWDLYDIAAPDLIFMHPKVDDLSSYRLSSAE